MKIYLIILFLLFNHVAQSQKANSLIFEGNDAYKKQDYKQAIERYSLALSKDPDNTKASFNLGNALKKDGNIPEAEKKYIEATASATNELIKAQAFYNQGLALINQKKLPEAVDAFKQSLRSNPADVQARENLQKALNELRQQQKSNENQNKQQPQQQKEQNKLDPQRAEQLLNQLRQQEKQVHKRLQQKNPSSQQQKDW